MFLVKDRWLGLDKYVFTRLDPRNEGYKGDVVDNVSLDIDLNELVLWPDGQDCPDPQLGRDPKNPKRYKEFKYPQELRAAGFELVHVGLPVVAYSWSAYRKEHHPPPEDYTKRMTSDEWFDFLEEADNASKIRRKLSEPKGPAPGSSREQIAEWIANRHMGADGAIHQIWFLPAGSPADEFRLLEVSERYTGEASTIEPIDFGLDIDGVKYKLIIADVSGDRLEKIKADPVRSLPKDWHIHGALVWDRRGRRQ